jgi:S-adenosylmethionine hydrolase
MPFHGRLGMLGFALAALMSLASATTARAAGPATICLFTDFGWDDSYVAQLKGVIVSIDPGARLLDLTHSVTPYNVTEGAYLLDQCSAEFPAGTIFVAVVDPGVGTVRGPLLIETNKGKYFVGPDNGLFARVIQSEGLLHAWRLDKPEFYRSADLSRTFHGRDIFGPVAAHLASGTAPEKLGTEITAATSLTLLPDKAPAYSAGTLTVQVEHLDRYGNVILNLRADSDLAGRLKDGNLVKISIARETYSAPLVKTYGDIEKGRLILLYGGGGLLEIAMNQGSAAKELKVQPGDVIFLKP